MCATLQCVDEDQTGDQRALQSLGRWLIRYTPIVSCGWEAEDPQDIPAALFLELTGCERLFGGIHRLIERIAQSLSRFNIPSQMAVAPAPGAAWAFALTGGRIPKIVDSASLLSAIERLPVVSLRLDEVILGNLHHLGLHSVGDLLRLPREQLPSRFGPLLLKRLGHLSGELPEPLTKLLDDPPIVARAEFDAPIDRLEDIRRIFAWLLDRLIADLTRQNHGIRQMRMLLKPDRGWGLPTILRTIPLSRPHRHRPVLLELIRRETEQIDCEHGFVRFQLEAPLHEPISEKDLQLFEQQATEERRELDRMLERLRARLEEKWVIQPQMVESYIPERAWAQGQEELAAVAVIPSLLRPITLFSAPVEVRVVCEPSDDRTGQPRQFAWKGEVHHLICAAGPERIAGEWWQGHRHTRDYYSVEDDQGRRFWLFRVVYSRDDSTLFSRWFQHGCFD